MDSNFTTEEVFESAVSIVRNLPKEGSIKPSDELKLKLYALYKQATHGPNDTPKPRFYQVVEAYKWDAWRKLGDISKEEAMLNYIRELKQIMDSIPSEEADPEKGKHFEDVLGKKFYDYWFQQWKSSGERRQDVAASDSHEVMGSDQDQKVLKNIDSQSVSSRGSSLSMLEETQSAGGDGYKTPNSLAFKDTFTGEISDQVASAILRLQHSLDDTVIRINAIETQLKQSMDSIRLIQNSTFSTQQVSSTSESVTEIYRSRGFHGLLLRIKAFHWFYLSYPFLVYFVIKTLERRRKRNSSR